MRTIYELKGVFSDDIFGFCNLRIIIL